MPVWVQEARLAHKAGLELDHAVAMVAERTAHRYAMFAEDADTTLPGRYEPIAGTAGNVASIMLWLKRSPNQT